MNTSSIDTTAFRTMNYGMYVISTKYGETAAGCIVNTFQQVTSTPARVSVAVNKENHTAEVIADAGRFETSVLAESASMDLIGTFGFKSSADIDKFAATAYELDHAGIPFVTESAVAHVGARVIETVDVGTHLLFIGEVECAEVLTDEPPMTYAYYHQVKGGKTPPKASSYEPANAAPGETGTSPNADATGMEGVKAQGAAENAAENATGDSVKPRFGWRCKICGYILEQEEIPDDFVCPLCGMGRDMFERVEL